jgi:hypothetical protein
MVSTSFAAGIWNRVLALVMSSTVSQFESLWCLLSHDSCPVKTHLLSIKIKNRVVGYIKKGQVVENEGQKLLQGAELGGLL